MLSKPFPSPRLGRFMMALALGTSLAAGPLAPMLAGIARADALPPAASATTGLGDRLPSFAPMVERVLPAVVNISAETRGGPATPPQDDSEDNDDNDQSPQQGLPGPGTPFDELFRKFFEQGQPGGHFHGQQRPRGVSLGSGFIVDPSGYIVTNNHVIGDADKVTVIFQDDSRHPAKIIGKDAKSDLALLKIETSQPLPAVSWGDSDKSRVGDWVVAVGNPFALGGTVTKGIISARGRPIADSTYVDFLQIDAAINKGNSGGPTFNLAGEVIGINSAILSPNGGSVGIGFAIPSDTAKPIIDQLRNSGHVDRGWLGVQIQEITPQIAHDIAGLNPDRPVGALVSALTDGSPAAKAGIKIGDVILKFDGRTVEKMRDLPHIVADTPIGKKVDIEVLRNGKHETLTATTAQLEDAKLASNDGADKAGKPAQKLGLYLSALSGDARQRLGIGKDVQGVLVQRVRDNTPAAEAGIEAGDVIVQINGQTVSSPEDSVGQLATINGSDHKTLLLLINRHGSNRFVSLAMDESKN